MSESHASATPNDGALVAQALEGGHEALDALYRHSFRPLVRYCRKISDEDPEDLAQEAWSRALASLHQFDTTRPLWPWLKTIAAHAAVDIARKRRPEVLLASDEMGAAAPGRESSVEERSLLAAAMAALTPGQRTAVGLRYVKDWEMGRAAEFMSLSQPAFRRLLFRARQHLRAEYTRLSQGAMALAAAWSGRLRRIARNANEQAQRIGGRSSPLQTLGGEGLYQLVAGVMVLSLLAGPSSMESLAQPGAEERISSPWGDPTDRENPRMHDVPPPTPGRKGRSTSGDPPDGGLRSGGKSAERVAGDMARWATDPASETEHPEDARILSIHPSPRFHDDGVAYATGASSCGAVSCPTVLFETRDRGSTWTRLPAEGLVAEYLLLPPAFGDDRIFAMGGSGLLVSIDGGQTFSSPSPGMGPHAAGPAAMSPAFSSGDPFIMIGGSTPTRYRDGDAVPETASAPTSSSPLEPAYSPNFAEDGLVMLGGTDYDPVWGKWNGMVHRCLDDSCTTTRLPDQTTSPKIRMSPYLPHDAWVLAFTSKSLFSSADRGETFDLVSFPAPGGSLADVHFLGDGSIAAAVLPGFIIQGGIYVSIDRGESWASLDNPLLEGGVRNLAVAEDRIFAALAAQGIACSTDGGVTWSPRC